MFFIPLLLGIVEATPFNFISYTSGWCGIPDPWSKIPTKGDTINFRECDLTKKIWDFFKYHLKFQVKTQK